MFQYIYIVTILQTWNNCLLKIGSNGMEREEKHLKKIRIRTREKKSICPSRHRIV